MKSIRPLFRCIAIALTMAATSAQSQPAGDAHEQDRVALRAVLSKATQALNTRNIDSLTGDVHPGLTVITVDNQKLVGLDAFKNYYATLFDGPKALLNKLEIKPIADEGTRFLDDNSGVAYGASEDTYHFKDGDVSVMNTRWSATVQKDGGTWKIVSVHFSANVTDNPVLSMTKKYALKFALAAGAGGLVVGALLMALLRGRRRA